MPTSPTWRPTSLRCVRARVGTSAARARRGLLAFAFVAALTSALAGTRDPAQAQFGNGFGAGSALAAERTRLEAALAPDHLDAAWSISTTAEARIRSALESVRRREGPYRAIRGQPDRARRWRLAAFAAVLPIWQESVRQIDALLSPGERERLRIERAAFRNAHARARESDPPLPGGYAGISAPRSQDVGGFVLRVLLRAQQE